MSGEQGGHYRMLSLLKRQKKMLTVPKVMKSEGSARELKTSVRGGPMRPSSVTAET